MMMIILISMVLCFGQNVPPFDGTRAMDLLITQCSFAPRFPGSKGYIEMKKFMQQFLYIASIWILPVLVSITFHEAAHGYSAMLLGDDTAQKLGRVTLNPLKHIDNVGTIILPLLLIS